MKFKVLFLLCFLCSYVNSGQVLLRPTSEDIERSELIFRGVLINKYSDYESPLNNEKADRKSVYTTFVFEVTEILKGVHDEDLIEVKMYGGCIEGTDDCFSTSADYYYELNDDAVMFLNSNKSYGHYQSLNFTTAYKVEGSVEVLTSEGNLSYLYENNESGKPVRKDVLTLPIIKLKIKEIEN